MLSYAIHCVQEASLHTLKNKHCTMLVLRVGPPRSFAEETENFSLHLIAELCVQSLEGALMT